MSTPTLLKSVLKLPECNVTLLSSYCVYTYIACFHFYYVYVSVCVSTARHRQWWINTEYPSSPLAIPNLFSFSLFHWIIWQLLNQVWEAFWYSLNISNDSLRIFAVFPLLHSGEVMQWLKTPLYSPSEWHKLVQHTVAAVNWKRLEEM